jgi:hypothetical protein
MTRVPDKCSCGSGLPPKALLDGYGIFMCYVCPGCRERKLAKFRPDIFEQYETSEQIEPD